MFSVAIAKMERLLHGEGCTKLDWVPKTVRYGTGQVPGALEVLSQYPVHPGRTSKLAIQKHQRSMSAIIPISLP